MQHATMEIPASYTTTMPGKWQRSRTHLHTIAECSTAGPLPCIIDGQSIVNYAFADWRHSHTAFESMRVGVGNDNQLTLRSLTPHCRGKTSFNHVWSMACLPTNIPGECANTEPGDQGTKVPGSSFLQHVVISHTASAAIPLLHCRRWEGVSRLKDCSCD